jgi:hypothetical protein
MSCAIGGGGDDDVFAAEGGPVISNESDDKAGGSQQLQRRQRPTSVTALFEKSITRLNPSWRDDLGGRRKRRGAAGSKSDGDIETLLRRSSTTVDSNNNNIVNNKQLRSIRQVGLWRTDPVPDCPSRTPNNSPTLNNYDHGGDGIGNSFLTIKSRIGSSRQGTGSSAGRRGWMWETERGGQLWGSSDGDGGDNKGFLHSNKPSRQITVVIPY